MGKLGKHSRLKRGVKIIGNGKRIRMGQNFIIWHRCFLAVKNGTIDIGNNGHLGVGVYVNSSKGNLNIGDNVAIGPYTQIYTYSDSYQYGKLIGEIHQVGDISIKDNVFIGSGAILLPGITIETGAVIGAGAVVRCNVPAYTIVGGVPATFIKKIKDNNIN